MEVAHEEGSLGGFLSVECTTPFMVFSGHMCDSVTYATLAGAIC